MTRTKNKTLGLAGITLGLMLALLMQCTRANPPTPAPTPATAPGTTPATAPAPAPALAPASTVAPAPAVAEAPPPAPWVAPPEAQKLTNSVKATSQSTSQGKQNYMQGCYACHGEKGDGKGANAATLNPHPSSFTDKAAMAKISDGELFWKITNGDGKGMPAYNSQYSDTERWNLVNYIRAFKAMPSPASAPAKPAAPATGKKPAAKKH